MPFASELRLLKSFGALQFWKQMFFDSGFASLAFEVKWFNHLNVFRGLFVQIINSRRQPLKRLLFRRSPFLLFKEFELYWGAVFF